jgi:hypothetical protein
MKKEMQEVMAEWCWLVSTGGIFKVTTFHCDEPIGEISVEEYLRVNYPTDKRVKASSVSDGTEYLATSSYFEPEHAPSRAARRRARLSRKRLLHEPAFWLEGAMYALSLTASRRNYQLLVGGRAGGSKPMKQAIQELLDSYCWATFTEGRFRITRFGCAELLAEVSVEELVRSLPDRDSMGGPAMEISEGVEVLVPGRPSRSATPRGEPAAGHLDPESKPVRSLRWIRWALAHLSSRTIREARGDR